MNEEGRAAQIKDLAPDLARATKLVEELSTGPHKGLTMFACQGRDIFLWDTLAVPAPNLLQVGFRPTCARSPPSWPIIAPSSWWCWTAAAPVFCTAS